ncbi:Myc-type, basic helix-loop-helix domain-containing protein [Tanacetum coccineum]
MQKGDDDQHERIPTSQGISEHHAASSQFHEVPYTSVFYTSKDDVTNFEDIIKVLTHVELPSPSPVLATCCTSTREDNLITFHEGQSSGTKKDDETKDIFQIPMKLRVNAEQRETELEDEHDYLQEPHETQFFTPRTQNTERRDQASILDDTIAYIKSLQMQLQSMGASAMPQGPYFTVRPMYEMGYMSTGHYASYFTSSFPIFQPFASGFDPSVPPMENFVGSPRLLQIPHQEFPSHTTQPACSDTLSSDTIIPTTDDQIGSGISSQYSYHMPVTNQRCSNLQGSNNEGIQTIVLLSALDLALIYPAPLLL